MNGNYTERVLGGRKASGGSLVWATKFGAGGLLCVLFWNPPKESPPPSFSSPIPPQSYEHESWRDWALILNFWHWVPQMFPVLSGNSLNRAWSKWKALKKAARFVGTGKKVFQRKGRRGQAGRRERCRIGGALLCQIQNIVLGQLWTRKIANTDFSSHNAGPMPLPGERGQMSSFSGKMLTAGCSSCHFGVADPLGTRQLQVEQLSSILRTSGC